MLACVARLVEERRQEVLLGAVHVHEAHGGRLLTDLGIRQPEAGRGLLPAVADVAQVVDPRSSAIGHVDPLEEGRDHLAELLERQLSEMTRLRQRRAEQAHHELLVGLAAREHADVAERRRRQQPAHCVERLRVDRAPPDGLGLLAARVALAGPRAYSFETLAVQREDPLHRLGVWRAEALVPEVAVAAARELAVVGDVARGLLEVGRKAPALEDLREHVRAPLDGQVRTAELSNRVVSEL
jgi:hypothetical protein